MANSGTQAEADAGDGISYTSAPVKVLIGSNPNDYIGGSALLTEPRCDLPQQQYETPLEIPFKEPSTFPKDDDDDIIGENGLELQIALDSMAMGNLEPLKRHLARIEGVDPEKVSIRSRPYDFEEDRMPGSQLRYIGQLDQIGEPESSLPESPPRSPKVNLDIRDQLYQYHFLRPDRKQIRLLRLGPKDEDSVIHTLELQTFDLSEAPRFYALSYVWGQPDKNMPLPCNGGKIMLTANLFRAIHKTFSRFPDVWLWADGICINQNDLIERGNQVNMMGEIYGRATLVIAHTGHHEYKMVPVDSESVSPAAVETVHTNQTVGIEDLQLSDTPPIDSSDNEESIIDSGSHHSEDDTNLLDTSQPAISLMNYLTRIWTSDGDYSLMEDKDWAKRKVPDFEGGNETTWLKLFVFWNEDWFYRSWVLQEAVLGKKVILLVNDAACSLDFVMKFWDLAKKRDTPEFLKRGPLADEYARVLHLSPVSAMKALRDFKHRDESHDPKQQEAKSDLLSLLGLSRINLASDPRDKIYSLLSLAKGDSLANSITPDYSAANTAAKLYQTIAAMHVKAGLGHQLLQYAGIDHKIVGLPSWAPDWSYQSRSNLHSHLYNCSGLSIPSLSLSEAEPDKLQVKGAIIDTINFNGMPWRYYSIDRKQERFARFKEAPDNVFPPFTDEDSRCLIRVMAKRLAAENCPKFDSSEAREDAVARTLVMDCTWRGERTELDPSFLDSWNAFERLYGKGPEEDTPADAKIHKSGIFHWIWDFDEEEESTLRRKSWPFEVAFQEAHKGRRFCTTGDGYMCTTPYDTERGDVVVILEGFRTPFVLRKSGDNWRLVGDCYVDGIMDGELVVPLRNCEVRRNEIAIDANGEPFALRTSSGFAKFQEFGII